MRNYIQDRLKRLEQLEIHTVKAVYIAELEEEEGHWSVYLASNAEKKERYTPGQFEKWLANAEKEGQTVIVDNIPGEEKGNALKRQKKPLPGVLDQQQVSSRKDGNEEAHG